MKQTIIRGTLRDHDSNEPRARAGRPGRLKRRRWYGDIRSPLTRVVSGLAALIDMNLSLVRLMQSPG